MKEPMSLTDLVAIDYPDTELVTGGLAHQGSRILLGGDSGMGKSYVLLQLLFESAEGKPWLGIWPVRRPLRSLLVQTEVSEPLFQRRIKRWGSLPDGMFVLTQKEFLMIDEAGSVARFCDEHDIDIVGLDPLYQMHGGDENSTHTIRPAEQAGDRIAGDKRILIVVHHVNKVSQQTGQKPSLGWLRGASAWHNWIDTGFMVAGRRGEDSFELHVVKARNREERMPNPLRLTWHKPGPYLVAEEMSESSKYADVMEIVSSGPVTRKVASRRLASVRGCSRATAYRIIKEAVERGLLEETAGQLGLDSNEIG